MPSSFIDSVPPIVKLLIERQARFRSIVDIGPGWGKFGLLAREFLPDLEVLDAVEVPQGRLGTQDAIYDRVLETDVRTLPSYLWDEYDLALMIDVIEHMTIEEGQKVVRDMTRAGCQVLVSTPKVWMEQSDEHNPHETHVSHWRWEQLSPYLITEDISTIDSLIFLLGA